MRSPRFAAALVFACFGVMLVPQATLAQAPYTFEVVADSRAGGLFSNFGYPVINGNGDVAFAAQLRTGGSGIYKWHAATRTLITIFEDPTNGMNDFPEAFSYPAITPTGDVIFQYDERVRIGSGGATNIVADENTLVPLGGAPGLYTCVQPRLRSRSTTGDGRVVIDCFVVDINGGSGLSGAGVYLAGVGQIDRICDAVSGGQFNIFSRCFLFDGGPIEVTAGGVLAGIGQAAGRVDQFGLPRSLLLRGTASGLEILLDPGVDTALAFPNRLNQLGINGIGTVVFDAFQDTPGASGNAVFKIDVAGLPISITDPRTLVYRQAYLPSINNAGEIPFVDLLLNGLFIGPNPSSDKVIVRGDQIPGETSGVNTVWFDHPGINSPGELAFLVSLGDGTLVIVRALPPNDHAPDVAFGPQSSPQGTPVNIHVSASDQDGDYPLTYALVEDASPPPGTVTPPRDNSGNLAVQIDANGDITGVFGAGTAGTVYAFTLTVTDSRGRSTSIEFTWTVTESLPPPRLNLRATANAGAQGIDLTWQNPSPDTATGVLILYSTNGPGGPYLDGGLGPVSQTSQLFIDPPFASGVNYCFKVKGFLIGQSGLRVLSLDSNIACATYPLFAISDKSLLAPEAVDSTSFRVTTTMPALTMSFDATTVSQLPAGAVPTITMVNSTTFDILITNLPVQSTSTAYTIGLIARSNPVNLLATKTIPFNTVASSSGGRLTPRNTPNIHVTAVDRRFTRVERNIVSIEVDITNQSGYPEAINVRVRPETKVEWRCITPDPVDHCVEALNNDRLTAPLPEPISSLAPGESRRLRLNFALSPGEDQTVVDATHVFVVVTYDYVEGSGVSSGTTTDRLTVFLP